MFVFAISPKEDAFSGKLWPDHPTLHNFEIVFRQQHYFLRDFWVQFGNSAVIAGAVGALTLLIATAAAFSISRLRTPGGRIVVVDTVASTDPAKAAAFNRLEKLRDPSHVRALPLAELRGLLRTPGLGEPEIKFSELRDEVKNLLARSFPNPGDDAKITEMFAASLTDDCLGIPVRRDRDRIEYAYPVAILAAQRN